MTAKSPCFVAAHRARRMAASMGYTPAFWRLRTMSPGNDSARFPRTPSGRHRGITSTGACWNCQRRSA